MQRTINQGSWGPLNDSYKAPPKAAGLERGDAKT